MRKKSIHVAACQQSGPKTITIKQILIESVITFNLIHMSSNDLPCFIIAVFFSLELC